MIRGPQAFDGPSGCPLKPKVNKEKVSGGDSRESEAKGSKSD